MKLGIITSMAAAPWGGSEELWFALAKDAIYSGTKVSVSLYDWGEKNSKIQLLEKAGVNLYFRSRISFNHILGKFIGKFNQWFKARRELELFVNSEKPDVLLVSMGAFCDFEIDSLRKFLLSIEKPFYIVVHSNNDDYEININKIESIKKLIVKAVKICFVSQRMQSQAESQLKFQFTNAKIVRNPLNITDFEVLKQPSFDVIKMACVGSIIFSVKGQDVLLKILSSPKWKSRSWILSIFGDGPDKLKLQNMINQLGLQNKVIVKGFTNRIKEDVWLENHILLLPSFIEGMPIVLIEAMLCGRTAVVNNVGGVKEVLQDGLSGFISDEISLSSFENKLEEAWNKRGNWENLGKIAFSKGLEFYGKNPIEDLLKDLKLKQ